MQVMQLPKHLLLLAAALTASGAGRAAAQEFVAVPASTSCTANTVTVDARSDIECAVKCSHVNSSLSYSFINGVCILSDRPDCAASNGAEVFRKLVNECMTLKPAPNTLNSYSNYIGKCFEFNVTGGLNGTVWGTDIYTGDSTVSVAAVHAGVVLPGQSKRVRARVLPGQTAYQSSTRNGVTSAGYGNWPMSYQFT